MYATPIEKHAMHQVWDENTRSSSTTLRAKRSTLRESPPSQSDISARRAATSRLSARDVRKPLSIQVQFVGNGDCEWLVTARGKRYKFAGCENVHECLSRLSRATFR